MGDSLPWTPMIRRAKYDASSFILGGKSVTVQTNTHTNRQTVTDISTPCLSACVNNEEITSLSTYVYSVFVFIHLFLCRALD